MARSSRHKSHRSHKHRDRSESEDEGSSRDRKMKVAEEESARVSRVSDQEKRKSSSKDGVGTSNGDVSGDYGKKRKDRDEDSAIVGDRWNGGGDDDARVEKESKKEGSDAANLEKSSKSKSLGGDSKGKSNSSRRREGSSEKNEEKRRLEKESSRRESSSSRCKDEKEKDKDRERERGSEKDKKDQDFKHERSDDRAARREERSVKPGIEISELQDEMHNPDIEKESDKRSKRRRGGSGDLDRLDDGRKGDGRQESSRVEHSKNGSYKDGRYKEKYREELDKEKYREELDKEKYREELDKEKYREELDRDQRHHDYKRKDERSSRAHTSERSDSKHYRDDRDSTRRVDDEKTKLHDSDRGGSRRVDDNSTKLKDNRGRKRSSAEIEDQNDMKSRSAKEPREDGNKNGSSSSKFDSRSDRARLEHPHSDRVDSSLSNSRTKNSPNASAYSSKDQIRHNSSPASRDHSASGGRERISGSRSSEKAKLKDNIHSDAFIADGGSFLHHDRVPRSDTRSSPSQLREKSPTSERRSERITSRRSLDMEEGGQRSSSSSKGKKGDSSFHANVREREYLAEKPSEADSSQVELFKREHVSVGSSSSRAAQLQGSSPGHLPPPPPVRIGVDSPSVLGSYEDDTRSQNGERKINTRYKRGGDSTIGRGPGTPWKGPPTWPSPVANGFMPLQHGPSAGFHPGIQQFPAPSLFGMRPPMDLNNPSYHIHEGNRFPGHVRPFGWHNAVDDCPPHLQVWDGNANVFGDESHIYGRQEWDQNRHLLSSRGWEMSTDMWSRQNANANIDRPAPWKEDEYSRQAQVDEASVGNLGHNSRDEKARSEQPVADASGIKLPSDSSLAKRSVRASSKSPSDKTPELSKMPGLNGTSEKQSGSDVLCCTYLSKLDISPDLVKPELYKQCISLMEGRERDVTDNFSIQGRRKNNVERLRLVAKSEQKVHKSLFPTASETTFRRAMSLYKKQMEAMKEAMHIALPLVCSEQQNNSPESNNENVTAKSMDHVEGSLPTNLEEDNNTVAADGGEGDKNPSDPEEQPGDKPSDNKAQQVEISVAAEEKGFVKNSDAVISVEGSKQSEAIIPECRANLSRIHLSPESTH
ncbi:uncharacterized protein A4U43_C05F28310 [Asparagus officinalis]|uniref:Uncharacterized protein n=1 Tax=Asparagus officinalis TaxID=4686 RepID=A0A5P1EXL7_ASPOF|nr:zinc finger CCCH domain-containing protein 13-like [Asparagus officinalis]ONK69927.1 uncharacterized protein A4U43_C05F28310 [Asparagus officinalis]